MDRTSIILLAICFLVLILWYPLVVNKLYPPKPLPVTTNSVAGLTNYTGTNTASLSSGTNTTTISAAPPQMTTNAALLAEQPTSLTNAPEELVTITNLNARYTFTSQGGGLKFVELLKYPEKTSSRRQRQKETNHVATLNGLSPVPTMALWEGSNIQGEGDFKLSQTETGVRAEKVMSNGLAIVKDFALQSNYLVTATVKLENRSAQPLTIPAHQWFAGTATPVDSADKGEGVGVLWYNGGKTEDVAGPWFANRTLGCLPGTPRKEYRSGTSNVVWVAAHNSFFALVVMPRQPGQEVVAREITLPRPTGDAALLVATNAPAPLGYATAVAYPQSVVAPGQSQTREFSIYAGPKEYRTLARIGDQYNNNLDALMNFGWFGFVSKALLLGMNWLHNSMKLSYGWAIIAITLVIKLIYWPLTQASTRSMKRMQALQPQMAGIREKYKDDPLKMNRKTMEFMKEHKVSPLGGCLPSLLQIPVFFGFYRMIQSAIELRGEPFLWVGDLSKSDTLYMIPGLGFIPFIGIPGVGLPFNLLPLIMGATMLWQARLTPPSPGMDPMQAKMMRYMPLMFMVFLYNFSAGLTLYWTVQNLFTILQTKLTPVHVEPLGPTKVAVLTPVPKKRK